MSEKQMRFIERLCRERDVTLEHATKAALGRRQSKIGSKSASKIIDWLLAQPAVREVPRPPTAKQMDFLRSLARKAGVDVPRVETAKEASAEIDRLKALAPTRPRRGGGGRRRGRRVERDCEDCLSVGPCGPNCEYAHIFGRRS